jgi:hypothetical protein
MFYRTGRGRRLYQAALEEWLRGDDEYCAMAHNVMYDHRVNAKRDREFRMVVRGFAHGRSCSGLELEDALTSYFERRVRSMATPDFASPTLNKVNIVRFFRPGHAPVRKLPEDTLLARVIVLNGLWRLFVDPTLKSAVAFRDLVTRISIPPATLTSAELGRWRDDEVSKWLREQLDPSVRGHTSPDAFIANVLALLEEARVRSPYQPAWVTTWAELRRYKRNRTANRWLEIVGVPRLWFEQWVIVLAYPIRDAGTVARPTILDRGWGSLHFPSPPGVPAREGGHPMDLRVHPAARALRPEYVHEQQPLIMAHWERSGRLVDRAEPATSATLREQREAHLRLLTSRYPGLPADWMPTAL